MKTFSASWVFPLSSPPIKNGVITVDDKKIIADISEGRQGDHNFFEGIIAPGFINAHCHLELSHLKGQISEKKGMTCFISELVSKRNLYTEAQVKKAIADAEAEMIQNGIAAVGDISNTVYSFEQKARNNLCYHTFLELFDLHPSRTGTEFEKGTALLNRLLNLDTGLRASFVPHAPYTVTPGLFQLINELRQDIICMHNQESGAENELFISKSGSLYELLARTGSDFSWFKATGKNSLQSVLPLLDKSKKIQLVHNTYTSAEDMEWTQSRISDASQIYFCTCPNANLYIEDQLPDYNIFINAKAKMTIGTDSYASNHSLSILDEMKTIQNYFPEIPLHTITVWAAKNGAEFLGIEKTFGTIEKGKKPGLVLIENCDTENLKLTARSRVRRLV